MADRTNGLNNIDIGSGRRGFRNRNLGLGQAGTVVDAEWANGIQEEIVRLIELLGITPSPSNREQMVQAIRRLAGGNVATLTANTTLTADSAGLILASAAGGNVTLTLPAASAAGGAPLRVAIVRTDSSANMLNIVRGGSDTLNGLTTNCPLPVGASVTLLSDGGSAWRLVGSSGLAQIDVFTANGTAVAPWWANQAEVMDCVGGGGGGGGASVAGAIGGGGGGGEWASGLFRATPGGSTPVTIGAGGAGGTAAPTSGGNGGTTSFGSLITAVGGVGGNASGGGSSNGGAGGTGGSGGNQRLPGGGGGAGYLVGGGAYVGSQGGHSQRASPSSILAASGAAAGTNGNGYGGGAGGAISGSFGGTGAGGLVRVRWLP